MCSTTFDAQLIPDQNISQYQTGPEQVLSVISAQVWEEGRDTREMFYVCLMSPHCHEDWTLRLT